MFFLDKVLEQDTFAIGQFPLCQVLLMNDARYPWVILVLDKLNPQVAARQLGAFNSWRQYDEKRQKLMEKVLSDIASHDGLSPDVYEIVTKYLAV